MNRRRIVLLGIGHTNASIVKRWAEEPAPDTDLVCVSKFPFATYSGMLPGTLAGQFTQQEMQIDLRPLARRASAELQLAEVTGLDTEQQLLLFADAEPMHFDVLSIGIGSQPAGCGAVQSETLVPIKPMQTFLQRLDQRLAPALDRSQDSFSVIVVGGGVAGVEIALCLHARLANLGLEDRVGIKIITGGDEIADGLRSRSIRLLRKLLARRGIAVQTNSRVVDVVDQTVLTENGNSLPADCVVWATGATGPPLLSELGLPTDQRGFLQIRSTLQTTADLPIFAVGDSGTMTESPSPKAGVYAVRQAPILWKNLLATLKQQPLTEFAPQTDFLKILNTGQGQALLEYKWLSVHASWCMRLKTSIDKRFITPYQL